MAAEAAKDVSASTLIIFGIITHSKTVLFSDRRTKLRYNKYYHRRNILGY